MTIGNPINRIDGKLKVTGSARYAADFAVGTPLYAELVTSTIGLGRVTGVDDSAARQVPGVREVYSHANPLPVDAADFFGMGGRAQQSWQPFAEPDGGMARRLYLGAAELGSEDARRGAARLEE